LLCLLPVGEPGTGVRYYGWRIVALAALALGITAPGQTAGMSVFIDPMMDGLRLSRTAVSTAYLLGTLAGAVSMPWFGSLLDRRGGRYTLTAVVIAFSALLAAMAGVRGIVILGLVGSACSVRERSDSSCPPPSPTGSAVAVARRWASPRRSDRRSCPSPAGWRRSGLAAGWRWSAGRRRA
jgi:MFS family permease